MIEHRKIVSREQWLRDREPLLTASVMGAAAGIDPHKTALDLHLEKTGNRQPDPENALMRRGRILEAAAVEYIREEYPGLKLLRPGVLLIDHEHRIGATPDLLIDDGEPGLINCQIKVVARPTFEGWDGEPPLTYQLQVATENMLLDAREGILAVLVLSAYDAQLHTFPIPRNPKAEAIVLDIAQKFWDRIDRGVLPPADYGQDADVIRDLYPPDPAKPAPLDLAGDNRIIQLLEERERAKATEKAAVAECVAIDAEIIEKLAGSERAIAPGWRISHTMIHRKAYTTVVEAKDYPGPVRATRTTEEAA